MANFGTSPLAIDAYARFFANVFDERQIIAVSTVAQAFFGRPENGSRTVFNPDSAVVDIDIIRGNERLAALVPRGLNGRNLGDGQKDTTQELFSNINRIYPLIEEEGNIDGNQLLFRRPGENPYSGQTRLDRMRGHALDIHQEHIRRIIRLNEYLAYQSLLTGKMPAIFGTTDTNLLYDFLRPAGHIAAAPLKWDNASSDPLGDFDTAAGLIRSAGKAKADIALIGTGAMNALINHADIKALADNRRFELIQVGVNPVPPNLQRFVDAGAIPRGRLATPAGNEFWLFTDLNVYTNAAGTATLYMPTAEALFAASSARCDRFFGPPEMLPNIPMKDQLYQQLFGFAPGLEPMPPNVKDVARAVNAAMFYFDAYLPEGWKRVSIRTQSAPIFATTQTDAFVTLNTLI